MATIFTRIIQRDLPAYIVAESEHFIAFLDVSPIKLGHTLVVPKIEVDYIFDLESELLAHMMIFGQQVAKKIQAVIPCKRIGVAVIGLEVPHAHIHLVPIDAMNDLNFSNPKLQLSPQEMEHIATSIRSVP